MALWPGFAAADSLALTAGPRVGYNGTSPGPLLRVAAGPEVKLRLTNKLDAPTTLSVSGARSPVEAPLAPGESRELNFGTLEPGLHLYDGQKTDLFGAIVVDEAAPPPVDLDATVVFSGQAGSEISVNGSLTALSLAAPPRGRVRLRLANASPAVILTLAARGGVVQIVAVDGQPCEMFAPQGGVFAMAPTARMEIMFDLPEAGMEFALRGDKDDPAIRITAKGEAVAARPRIAALSANPRLPREIALERAKQIKMVVSGDANGFLVNGGDGSKKPLFKVARGTPVTLTLVNQTEAPQTLRLEGHVARQLHALDDGWDPYWRDALLIGPGKTLHAAFVTDAPGRWSLASPSPERRAKGLAAWFQVS